MSAQKMASRMICTTLPNPMGLRRRCEEEPMLVQAGQPAVQSGGGTAEPARHAQAGRRQARRQACRQAARSLDGGAQEADVVGHNPARHQCRHDGHPPPHTVAAAWVQGWPGEAVTGENHTARGKGNGAAAGCWEQERVRRCTHMRLKGWMTPLGSSSSCSAAICSRPPSVMVSTSAI